MCLYYEGKLADGFSQSSGTSWFPRVCTIWALTKRLLRSKVSKKWLSSKCCHFVKMYFYGLKLSSSCKYSMWLHCVGKVSDGFSKNSGINWFPPACTIWALAKSNLLRHKVSKKWLRSKCCHFVKNYFFGIKLLHANFQCVYICKVSECFSKSCGMSWFPRICTIDAPLRIRRAATLLELAPIALNFLLWRYILSISMYLQSLMNFHRCLFKISRKNQCLGPTQFAGFINKTKRCTPILRNAQAVWQQMYV